MEEVKKLTCICCPIGCALEVKLGDKITVTGNTCKRGEAYGIAEVTSPTRVVTSTATLLNGRYNRVPVKTSAPIPKDRIFAVLFEIKKCRVNAPVKIGDVLIKNAAGCGADIIATRTIECRADND